jgi:outer membrane lipopolysaccharide assembly protein LptE/RlpB
MTEDVTREGFAERLGHEEGIIIKTWEERADMPKYGMFYRKRSVTVTHFEKNIALICICLLFVHCGYSLRGTGSFLPSHIKKIQIPLFKNLTTRYELDKKLTQGVIDEFVSRGKVEITSDVNAADAVLSGEIASFSASPTGFSSQGSADHYTISIVVRVVLMDSKNQKVIYSNPSYAFNEDYQVPQGKDFESVETEAIKKIAAKFARNLVVAILEGF